MISNEERKKRNRMSYGLFDALEFSPTMRALKCSPNEKFQKRFRKVQYALQEFVMRVPMDVLEELSKKFDKFYIHAFVLQPEASLRYSSEVTGLMLYPKALRASQKKLIGIIAHEMAHLYMGAPKEVHMTELHEPTVEDEADILAAKWGFEEVFLTSPCPLLEENQKYWPSM